MPITINNRVLFNDGEEVTYGDFNDLQKYSHALHNDIVAFAEHGITYSDSSDYTAYLRSVGNGGLVKPGASARVVTNVGGTIAQCTGTPDGLSPKYLVYQLSANELQTTISTNSSGNPRYDIIQVKLEEVDGSSETRDFEDATTGVHTTQSFNKKTRIQLTFSTKEGTPAGSPVPPAPDSGYVTWAYIYMPNGYNSAFTEAHLYDNRLPHRFGSIFIPVAFYNPAGYDMHAGYVEATSGSVNALCYMLKRNCRIISVAPIASGSGSNLTVNAGTGGASTVINSGSFNAFATLISNLPLWSNGWGSVGISNAINLVKLDFTFTSANSGDQFVGVHVDFCY